jgi:undecaprenyl-diphosphatase
VYGNPSQGTQLMATIADLFKRLDQLELSLCLSLNRISRRQTIETFFALISRLGNGIFWYLLILVLAVFYFPIGTWAALHMASVSLIGLLLYKLIKGNMIRQRPSITWASIHRGAPPLDAYSFPSGHTLHAVSFSIIAIYYYPGLAWLLIPMVILIALSRVILGLHYPTDVAAGATIGGSLALFSLKFI